MREKFQRLVRQWRKEEKSCRQAADAYEHDQILNTQYESYARTFDRCSKDVEKLLETENE